MPWLIWLSALSAGLGLLPETLWVGACFAALSYVTLIFGVPRRGRVAPKWEQVVARGIIYPTAYLGGYGLFANSFWVYWAGWGLLAAWTLWEVRSAKISQRGVELTP